MLNLVCLVKCSAYGVVILLYAGYIKDGNAWVGQIWQSYKEDNTQSKEEKTVNNVQLKNASLAGNA